MTGCGAQVTEPQCCAAKIQQCVRRREVGFTAAGLRERFGRDLVCRVVISLHPGTFGKQDKNRRLSSFKSETLTEPQYLVAQASRAGRFSLRRPDSRKV